MNNEQLLATLVFLVAVLIGFYGYERLCRNPFWLPFPRRRCVFCDAPLGKSCVRIVGAERRIREYCCQHCHFDACHHVAGTPGAAGLVIL